MSRIKRVKEQYALNIRGYLLYDPRRRQYFFRVPDKDDPTIFEDYELTAEDIEIQLTSNFNALVENEDGSKCLDYNSECIRPIKKRR